MTFVISSPPPTPHPPTPPPFTLFSSSCWQAQDCLMAMRGSSPSGCVTCRTLMRRLMRWWRSSWACCVSTCPTPTQPSTVCWSRWRSHHSWSRVATCPTSGGYNFLNAGLWMVVVWFFFTCGHAPGKREASYLLLEDVPLAEFTYLVFTCMPGESYCRWFGSLLLCMCGLWSAY